MRQFFSFAFLSAISYLCHRVFDKSKWNTKDTAFKVDKSLPRLLPYAVCQIVRFDWNFCHQKVAIRRGTRRGSVFSAGQRSEHANKGCSPLFACSHVRGEPGAEPDAEPDAERAEAASPLKPASYAGGGKHFRPYRTPAVFFRGRNFFISFFLPNFGRTSNTQRNGDTPQSDPVLRRGIPRNDRGTHPVGHHPHQTLHPVRRAESLLLPRPARGQKPLGKGRLRAGKPDTRNSATMNAPVIMQFRPPLAASIPLRGRVAGAGRTRKRGRKPQTRRLRRPGATQTTNQ